MPRKSRPSSQHSSSPQSGAKPDPRDLILDTAELLFAERGFFGVSVRDITDAAGLRLASVNYYFKTKDDLLKAVVVRRFQEVDAERQAMFAALEPKLAKLSKRELISQVVDIFVLPILNRVTSGQPGWAAYAKIIAHGSNVELWATGILASVLDPAAREFLDLLRRAYPDADDHSIYCAYELMIGAMSHMLGQNGRIDTLSDHKYRSSDLVLIYPKARLFAVGGMMAICAGR